MDRSCFKTITPACRVALQAAVAFLLTALLLGFLVLLRILGSATAPDQALRQVEVAPARALPAPPPPPAEPRKEPPAALPAMPLPRLELNLDQTVPALKATLDPRLDLTLELAMFELEPGPIQPEAKPSLAGPKLATRRGPQTASLSSTPRPEPVKRSTYDSGELDGTPRLRNHPSATFPQELLRQGIREGRVLLEVLINASGSVSVRRVLSSSHPLFTDKARAIAAGARFTTPTKNGQPVSAIYRWPIVLRP